MSRWKIGCAAVALWVGTGGFASAETLREALRTAYVNNPQIEAQRKSAQIAQEQLAQARAQRRPQVNLSGSVGYESVESNRPFSLNVGERPLASAQLEAVVPVYVGGRIKSGIEQAKAGIGVANAQLEGVSQDLILQVVTSYVDVLRDRQTIAIRENSVRLLEEQLQAAQDRFDVGEVTRTDVAQAAARYEGSVAALAGAQADLEGSLAAYAFLVGVEADFLAPVPDAPVLPPDLEEAVAFALSQNPDLEAARLNERVASEAIRGAAGQLRPTVSIIAGASIQENYDDDNFRDSNASITGRVTVPLFEGGLTRSTVRSARLQRDQARFQSDNTERQIRARVAQAWFANIAANQAIEASLRQVEAAEIAYEGAQEELAVGVRTTLDVLDQEQQLLEARLNLIRAERDAYVAAHQLLRAMGGLEVDVLNLDVAPFDPQVYGDKVRRKWLLTKVE